MPDDLVNERAVIGGNAPPLAELLSEETQAFKTRAEQLLAAAGAAVVIDRESAEKATMLLAMVKDLGDELETAREARKKPFLEGGRLVDSHFAALRAPLVGPDPKKGLGGAAAKVLALVDGYRREEERKAAAEKARLEEEARQAREAAEKAERERLEAEERDRRAAEEAQRKIKEAEEAAWREKDAAARAEAAKRAAELQAQEAERKRKEEAEAKKRLDAELEQRRQRERAEALQRQAEATRAAPIDTGLGVKAHARKVVVVTITDLRKATAHCLKVAEAEMRETVQKIYDRLARAKIRDLPGAEAREDTATSIHR